MKLEDVYRLYNILPYGQNYQLVFKEKAMEERSGGPVQELMRMSVPCVGGQHHHLAAAIQAGLKVRDEVALVREPTNAYDKNAVEVFWRDESSEITMKLGYVKKNFAADLTYHMDKGMQVKGKVALVRANSCMIDVEEVRDGKEASDQKTS